MALQPSITYRKSQQALDIPVHPSRTTSELAVRICGMGPDSAARRALGQELLDSLCRTARIQPVPLVMVDAPQKHTLSQGRLASKTYGFYRSTKMGSSVIACDITIYNRTAIFQQPISSKVFLNTLLHEWCHHWDLTHLRLSRSLHTRGFYTRLRLLCDTLFPQD